MVVKTIFVIKHSFGSFEVDSISPVSETANDIRSNRISQAQSIVLEVQTYTIETHIQMEPLHGLMRKLLEQAFLI